MGIPKFFRWISERYPMCSQLITDKAIPEFDNLYLDMNGIIHNCSHNNNDSAHFRITEEQIWLGTFNYIDHLFSKIKPKKFFFLAVDGVAPRAKMNQQRSRRFRTAKDAEDNRQKALSKGEELPEEDAFDSNCITPGTEFMKKLTIELRYFINKKVSEDADWRDVEIVLSGPEVPGEGEHKIMEYIRLAKAQPDYDPNTRHCLYGLDADLVMLGLLSHDPHFALLREEVVFGKNRNTKKTPLNNQNFYLMHLSLMREYLNIEFESSLKDSLTFDYDFERILDDFILLALFVGNDFLPHLPSLHINEGALDLMFKTYKEVLPNCEGYIQDSGRVILSRLQKLLDALSSIVEKQSFEAESIDMLYLSGKREDGQSERQLLHQIEQKKKNNNKKGKVMTDVQQQVFLRIKDTLVNAPKVRTVHFDRVFKANDKKFLNGLGRDLNMTFRVVHNPEDGSTDIVFEYETDDDSEQESELDEEALFARDRVLNKYDKAEIISANLTKEDIKREEEEKLDAGFKQWKSDYYMEKMHIDINNQEQMDGIIGSYIIGIQWVLKYYYEGVASWGWFYPYHYCPKISDLVNIDRFQDYPFELGQPFKPFEQLMGVLPSLSKKLLPRAYQTLMTETTSPIIDFYPTDFDLDMNGKKQDWEAVVKIPFIDEKRLLEAMKSREGQLTSEESSMSRIGTSWRIFYDKNIAQLDMDDIPSYESPLPGVFPDIIHCLAREAPYNLPTLDNGLALKKGLLSGTKLGKDALPGFPSLQTIPYSYEIRQHQVHVFQQDSRNESVVISINNRYTVSNIEDIAKLFLYRNIYVHYPYLQEAVVIGVSTSEKKYYVTFQNGKKQIREHFWDDKEAANWKQQMGRAEYINSKRFGLIVGEIEVGFHVCVLNGMRQTEDGALVKEFVNPSMEDLVPIQMVVVKVNNPDPRFFEKSPQPVSEKFPIGSTVFFLGTRFLGKQASVVGYSENNVDIEMLISTDKNYQSEPNFGHTAVSKQEREVSYMSLQDIARKLGMRPLPLSRLTSNICILDRGGKRVNMGLDMKSGVRDQKALGYSRKNAAGYWEFSTKAMALIEDFVAQFPQFVALLDQKNSEMMSVFDFDWVEDKNKEFDRMKEWRSVNKIKQIEKISFETDELEEKYVKMIEDVATQYSINYKKIPVKKVVIRGVPRNVLLKPEDAKMRLNYQRFSLGDRVIYATDTGSVPLGVRGTVVGVDDKSIDVLFDGSFMGGSDLGGRCSPFHGLNLPFSHVINVSNASHENTVFEQPPPTQKENNVRSENHHDKGSHRGGYRGNRNEHNDRNDTDKENHHHGHRGGYKPRGGHEGNHHQREDYNDQNHGSNGYRGGRGGRGRGRPRGGGRGGRGPGGFEN